MSNNIVKYFIILQQKQIHHTLTRYCSLSITLKKKNFKTDVKSDLALEANKIFIESQLDQKD